MINQRVARGGAATRLLNTCQRFPHGGECLAGEAAVEARRVRLYEQRLRDLNITIPTPYDAYQFCEHIAEQRGRPITLLTVDTRQAVEQCGLWLSTKKSDYILLDSTAPPMLREHILTHELAHMLCDHEGLLQLTAAALNLDLIDPTVVERVLGRGSGYSQRYDTAEEQEAEGLASVITGFAAHRSPVPRPRTPDTGPTSVLDRFSSALAADRRWL